MIYKKRELRRLWELKVYDGDPDAKKPKTKKETVVALNAVDATRRAGNRRLAVLPREIAYVTWPDNPGDSIYEIYDPSEGPTNKKVKPSIPLEDGGWD